MGDRDARAWRRIGYDEAELASLAFMMAHPECLNVDIQRGPWSLVCWCEQCKDLRTFELTENYSC